MNGTQPASWDWRIGSERIVETPGCDPVAGQVGWHPLKSLWIGAMTAIALIAGPMTFSADAFAVFLILTGITLCAGHSVGMHRRMIHHSFECPRWLDNVLIYLGTLVGMAGPSGMAQQHDLRDWAQRKPECHAYLCHRNPIVKDAWWQLHCDLTLDHPPEFRDGFDNRPFLRFLEATWMWQQLPIAIALYLLGDWGWVVWGVCARVSISVTGHWLIGYFAHNTGPRRWAVTGAGVQGYDVPLAALFSMGESWHNNHHAYPGSAKLGLFDDQPDPGWWLLLLLRRLGLAWNLRTPETLPERAELRRLHDPNDGCPTLRLSRRLWPRGNPAG